MNTNLPNASALLGESMQKLLKRYRDNRDLQPTVKWDKQADLKAISNQWLNKQGGKCVCASAGRFWLTTKTGDVIQVDVDNFENPTWYQEPSPHA